MRTVTVCVFINSVVASVVDEKPIWHTIACGIAKERYPDLPYLEIPNSICPTACKNHHLTYLYVMSCREINCRVVDFTEWPTATACMSRKISSLRLHCCLKGAYRHLDITPGPLSEIGNDRTPERHGRRFVTPSFQLQGAALLIGVRRGIVYHHEHNKRL